MLQYLLGVPCLVALQVPTFKSSVFQHVSMQVKQVHEIQLA